MNQESPYQALDQAQTHAYLSYLGLVVPPVGIIFGILSNRVTSQLHASNPDDAAALNHVRTVALWGIIASVVSAVVSILALVYLWIWPSYVIDKVSKDADQSLQEYDKAMKDATDTINSLYSQ